MPNPSFNTTLVFIRFKLPPNIKFGRVTLFKSNLTLSKLKIRTWCKLMDKLRVFPSSIYF